MRRIGFYSSRGGMGKTFILLSLASIYLNQKRSVCVIDTSDGGDVIEFYGAQQPFMNPVPQSVIRCSLEEIPLLEPFEQDIILVDTQSCARETPLLLSSLVDQIIVPTNWDLFSVKSLISIEKYTQFWMKALIVENNHISGGMIPICQSFRPQCQIFTEVIEPNNIVRFAYANNASVPDIQPSSQITTSLLSLANFLL